MKKISAILMSLVLMFTVASVASANGGLEIYRPSDNAVLSTKPTLVSFTLPSTVVAYQLAINQISGGSASYNTGTVYLPWSMNDLSISLPSSFVSSMSSGQYVIYIEGYYSGGYYSDTLYFTLT